jgi:hypothetical protein
MQIARERADHDARNSYCFESSDNVGGNFGVQTQFIAR